MDKVDLSQLPDDGSQQKEVFALAGLAIYQAQVWERSMINIYLIVKSSGKSYATLDDWDQDENSLSRKTAGQLLRIIKDEKLAPQKTLEIFAEALDKRNNLAHSFFFEQSEHFMLEAGRKIMADELCSMSDLFSLSNELAQSLTTPLSDAMGLLPSDITREGDRLVDRARVAIQINQYGD